MCLNRTGIGPILRALGRFWHGLCHTILASDFKLQLHSTIHGVTLALGQDRCHLADDIFERIFNKLTAPSPLKSTTSNYNKRYLFQAVNMYNKFNQTEHLYGNKCPLRLPGSNWPWQPRRLVTWPNYVTSQSEAVNSAHLGRKPKWG